MQRLEIRDGGLRPRDADDPDAVVLTLAPDADVLDTMPDWREADVVILTFPAFKDGRAFSQARLLRDEGYAGDIRAQGGLIRDQLGFAIRSGFSSFDIETEEPIADLMVSIRRYPSVYQPAAAGRPAWEERS